MDKKKVLKRLIILCWLILITCFCIKLIFGNYFAIELENEKILRISNFIDNHLIIKNLIYLILNLFTNIVYLLIVCDKDSFNKKQLIGIVIILVILYIPKIFNNEIISIIGDCVQAFLLPMIFLKPKKWYRIPLAFIIDLGFQYLSIITKNIGIKDISNDNFIIGIVFMIDYYIMLILCYLYVRQLRVKKEVNNDGQIR